MNQTPDPGPLFGAFFSRAPVSLAVVDVDAGGDAVIVAANPAQAVRFGLTVEQMVGRHEVDLLSPELLALHRTSYARAKALGFIQLEVPAGADPEARRFVALWWLGRVASGSDRFASAALNIDVSERARVRSEMSSLVESYEALVKSLPDSIFRVDHLGCILELHQAPGSRSLFVDRPERGAVFPGLFETASRPRIAEGIQRALETPDLQSIDIAGADASGHPMVVELRLVRSGDDEITIVHRDMTATRRMQEKLVLSERMASVGTLAAGIAHEVNNPLALVTANLTFLGEQLEALRARADPEAASILDEASRALADAIAGADRVRRTVRDLRSFARPASEGAVTVDVVAVMESCLRVAANEIRHKARLVRSFERVPHVMGNDAGIAQLFSNLIMNAAQSIDAGHLDGNEVRIVVRSEAKVVVIEVHDTGRGVPPEIAGRVFDPFFTTRSIGEGAGLGLAISHRIVQDHGGTISLRPRSEGGTIVAVRLPAAGTAPQPTPSPHSRVSLGERLRVLVVDDEAMLGLAVARMLRGRHDTDRETNANIALERIRAGDRWDVILCDLMMPELTGMDLYDVVLDAAPEQARRFIFMSGGAFTARARTFLERVPQPRLDKPFSRAALEAAMFELRSRPR